MRHSPARRQVFESGLSRLLRKIGAGDAGRDTLSLFDLSMEEDKAVLIISQEFIQRNVLYSRGRRSRPIGIGNYAVKGYGNRRGPASPVICASPTSVDMVDVFDAFFWKPPQPRRRASHAPAARAGLTWPCAGRCRRPRR